jgi:membrane associated rhomboid family serine protease
MRELEASGCLIACLALYRNRFALRDRQIWIVLAIWAVYQLIGGLLSPHIANFAHLGGLLGGALTGFIVKPTLLAPLPVENPWKWNAPT